MRLKERWEGKLGIRKGCDGKQIAGRRSKIKDEAGKD